MSITNLDSPNLVRNKCFFRGPGLTGRQDGLEDRDRQGSGGLEGMGLLRLRIRCAQCGLALEVFRVGTGKPGAVRKGSERPQTTCSSPTIRHRVPHQGACRATSDHLHNDAHRV